MSNQARASIVIPARNEAAVIGRCLAALAGEPEAGDVEVIVAANGCADRTVEIAAEHRAGFEDLVVLDLDAASKVGALNAGDRAARVFPRIYLDADIELGAGALSSLVEVLETDHPVVASPAVRFDCQGAGYVIRSFFDIFARLPYVTSGLVGLGVYGLSRSGRAKFGEFPPLTADDLFVQQLFPSTDRLRCEGTFTVRTPRRVKDLIAIRTRGALGKSELARVQDSPYRLDEGSADVLSRFLPLMRDVRLWPKVAIYVGVSLIARWRAASHTGGWLRDESSRAASVKP